MPPLFPVSTLHPDIQQSIYIRPIDIVAIAGHDYFFFRGTHKKQGLIHVYPSRDGRGSDEKGLPSIWAGAVMQTPPMNAKKFMCYRTSDHPTTTHLVIESRERD